MYNILFMCCHSNVYKLYAPIYKVIALNLWCWTIVHSPIKHLQVGPIYNNLPFFSLGGYSLRHIKEYNFSFLDRLAEGWKNSNTQICLPNLVSSAMEIRYDHLIRKVIRFISRIAFFVGFFQKLGLHFLRDGGSTFSLCTNHGRKWAPTHNNTISYHQVTSTCYMDVPTQCKVVVASQSVFVK
jgi:hypothetical protein